MSDRQSNGDFEGGLQSFGGGNGGNGLPNTSDFFNSDSFRATITSHDHRQEENKVISSETTRTNPLQQDRDTKVLDLQHAQAPFGQSAQEHTQYRGEAHNQSFEERKEAIGSQTNTQERRRMNEEGEEQLSPLNYEEFAYQQHLIEELMAENNGLKAQLQASDSKLKKVELQLQKTKQMIKELGTIKQDIQTLKQSADGVEEYDKVTVENEILKSKIQDMETRLNTMSRATDEARLDDQFRYEKMIAALTEQNRDITQEYRVIQQSIVKYEEEINKWRDMVQEKEGQINGMQNNWRELHSDYAKTLQEFKLVQKQNEELRHIIKEQETNAFKKAPLSLERDIQSSQRASLRNRSFSGDKGQEEWMNELNANVAQNYSQREKDLGVSYIADFNARQQKGRGGLKSEQNEGQFQGNTVGPQNQSSYQNNIKVKNYQPIQITIASPSEQTQALAERCKKLEEYCRELIRTNKILDCENRIAIAQILNLTEPQLQLQNLTAALSFVAKSGKIYDKKPSSAHGLRTSTSGLNLHKKENIAAEANKINKQISLKNLNQLRQVGAPPISQVFSNNNSSFIVQKYHSSVVAEPPSVNKPPAASSLKSTNYMYKKGLVGDAGKLQYASQQHRNSNPVIQLQNVDMNESRSTAPLAVDVPNELDITLNGLQDEVWSKFGVRLHLKKCADGYYQLGENIVNLKLDHEKGAIMIRVHSDEPETLSVRDQVSRITSTIYIDFIQFLRDEGYFS